MGLMGKCLKNIFRLQKCPENPIFIFSSLKFHSIWRSPTTKFHSISGSPTTKFHSISRSPTTALESSGRVRQSRSLAKGFTPQTEEHCGSLHKLRSTTSLYIYTVHYTLYTVNCTLSTVHCTLYTVHSTLYTVHCTLYTV